MAATPSAVSLSPPQSGTHDDASRRRERIRSLIQPIANQLRLGAADAEELAKFVETCGVLGAESSGVTSHECFNSAVSASVSTSGLSSSGSALCSSGVSSSVSAWSVMASRGSSSQANGQHGHTKHSCARDAAPDLLVLGSWVLLCVLELASQGGNGELWESRAISLTVLAAASACFIAQQLLLRHVCGSVGNKGLTRVDVLMRRVLVASFHSVLIAGCFVWIIFHAGERLDAHVWLGLATLYTLASAAAVAVRREHDANLADASHVAVGPAPWTVLVPLVPDAKATQVALASCNAEAPQEPLRLRRRSHTVRSSHGKWKPLYTDPTFGGSVPTNALDGVCGHRKGGSLKSEIMHVNSITEDSEGGLSPRGTHEERKTTKTSTGMTPKSAISRGSHVEKKSSVSSVRFSGEAAQAAQAAAEAETHSQQSSGLSDVSEDEEKVHPKKEQPTQEEEIVLPKKGGVPLRDDDNVSVESGLSNVSSKEEQQRLNGLELKMPEPAQPAETQRKQDKDSDSGLSDVSA